VGLKDQKGARVCRPEFGLGFWLSESMTEE